MAILTAQAKLYIGVRCWCVDKNISANLTSSLTVGNYNRPIQPNNEFVISPNILVNKLKRTVADLECVSVIDLEDERYKTYGGGNNVITPGSPRVVDNSRNWKVNSSLTCEFPTYIEIDIERLGLPEGTDVILNFEEGWLLEDRGRRLPSGAYEYPNAVQNALSPEAPNFVSFRTPKYLSRTVSNMVSSLTNTTLKIKQLAAQFQAFNNVTFRIRYNPGRFASLFVNNISMVSSAVKRASASASLLTQFGPSAILTALRIKQLQSNISNGAFNLSLPEFQVVIDFAAGIASQFTKTISSATSRIRFLQNFSTTAVSSLSAQQSRRRNTSSAMASVTSQTASINPRIIETALIENPNQGPNDESFGETIAMDGNTIVVGAPRYANTDTGRIYVFSDTGTLLRTIENPNSFGTVFDDQFGNSVAISGNYILAGAWYEDGINTLYKGAAYIINASTGAIISTITDPNNTTDYYTGISVAINETYAVIGQNRGGVQIYSTTTGQFLRKLNVDIDFSVWSVDISGDNVVVGTRAFLPTRYRVYQFSASTGNLIRTINNPNPSGTEEFDFFGYFDGGLRIFGNNIAIGASGEGNPTGSGRVYIFDATTGNLLRTLTHPTNQANSGFGTDLDLNNRYVIVSSQQQLHIFNLSDGTLERTITYSTNVSPASISMSGNKFVAGFYELNGRARVYSF